MSVIEEIKRPEASHIWQREEHEHYVEPVWCSERLFEVEDFDQSGVMLDPCCGFGRISDAAMLAGYMTVAADIVNRGYRGHDRTEDFLSCKISAFSIVSNPPFDRFQEFATHALSLADRYVAMIWLVRTLPAARWLRQTPLVRIHLLTPRPSMPPGHVITAGERPGGGKQDFCWLVWDKQHEGQPTIGWLHRDNQ